ncbi:MAG: hypothetical protein ACMUJM_13355 [bacterium]
MRKRHCIVLIVFMVLLLYHNALSHNFKISFTPAQVPLFYFNRNLIVSNYNCNHTGIQLLSHSYASFIKRNALIESSDSDYIEYILYDLSNEMNTKESIEFVALLGASFLENYDYERAYNGVGSGSVVSLEELLSSLKTGQPAGVCRDIAVGQAQILKSLGAYNTYVLRFSSAGYGHVTLITQDPDNRSTLYKLNYDELTTDQHSKGIDKLHQDTTIPDIGIYYHLYNTNGEPVAQLPSGLGMLLDKASLGSGQALDPFLHYSTPLLAIDFLDGPTSGRIFSGITGNQEEFSGLAFNTAFGREKDDIFHFQLQLASGYYESARSHVMVNANLHYSRFKSTLQSPGLRIGNLLLQGSSGTSGTILFGYGTVLNNDNEILNQGTVVDYGINHLYRLKLGWISDNRKASFNLNLTSHYYAALHANHNDIRKQKKDFDGIGFVHNYTLIEHEMDYILTPRIRGIVNVAYLSRNIGTQQKIEVGCTTPERKIVLGHIHPSKDLPNWVENSQECIYTKFQQKINHTHEVDFLIEFINDDISPLIINSSLTFSMYFL